jgi:hypothetical protein
LLFFNSGNVTGPTGPASRRFAFGRLGSEVLQEKVHEGIGPQQKGNWKLADTVESQEQDPGGPGLWQGGASRPREGGSCSKKGHEGMAVSEMARPSAIRERP